MKTKIRIKIKIKNRDENTCDKKNNIYKNKKYK